jgi:hypothetical protein
VGRLLQMSVQDNIGSRLICSAVHVDCIVSHPTKGRVMRLLPDLPRPMVGLKTPMRSFAKMFGVAMFGARLPGTPLARRGIELHCV